ncbi:MAG: DUF2975 domain-containing protein [Oscillospiraceae bacterium]|nr:DUF2975 domain-containing protein [Oscillospiraceae bacterium]
MNWTKDKSITLSRVGVAVFAALLLALDISCYWIAQWYARWRFYHFQYGALLMLSVYLGSVFGWICLWQLWKLLGNIRRGEVFVLENVRRMRRISWCCLWAALICLVSAAYYLPFGFVAIAAGFMALIVRIVKNAFQQAIDMKEELDYTV